MKKQISLKWGVFFILFGVSLILEAWNWFIPLEETGVWVIHKVIIFIFGILGMLRVLDKVFD